MATPKKTVTAAGSFRRRRSRTPHASITASMASGVTTRPSASSENSGWRTAAAVTSRIISTGWLLSGKVARTSLPYRSQPSC